MARAIKGIRSVFADVRRQRELDAPIDDPVPEIERDGIYPGKWPGFPMSALPPKCPVIPIGKTGSVSFLIDTLGQLREIEDAEWSKKMIAALFALTPHYPYWAWPRWKQVKKGQDPEVNGMDTDAAVACLLAACARRGLFEPRDQVRGRGGWADARGRFIWHSGNRLWTIVDGELKAAPPGEVDDMFYPRRPPILAPWEESVSEEDSPAHQLFEDLRTWNFERPKLDPFLILGAIACGFLGGALPWRPTVFMTGDRGVGKTTMQNLIKGSLGNALHRTANTTAAGIYQRLKHDALPVAVDELEASASNSKVQAVVELARLSSSGDMLWRGGQNHDGTEFRAFSTFFFSSINPPPMSSAEKSRMGMVNLGKLDRGRIGKRPVITEEIGRQLLRQLMQSWDEFQRVYLDWYDTLSLRAGFDGRACDTYGTLLAAAQILIGPEAMEDAGLPVTDQGRLGELIRSLTAEERAGQTDNWRDCLERILGSSIEGSWKGGEKQTVGGAIEAFERAPTALDVEHTQKQLALVGLGFRLKDRRDPAAGAYLCIPLGTSPALAKVFYGSTWQDGGWSTALKQGPDHVILRGRADSQVKINRVNTRCLLVDLAAYDVLCAAESEG